MSEPNRTRVSPVEVGSHLPHLERLRALGRALDSALPVPGTRFRIGLDGLIGLIPGVGDALGTLLGGYIVLQAARMGVPRSTLVRMIGNIGVDALVGAVPILGDLFDFGWKANTRNLALIEAHFARPSTARAQSRRVVALAAFAVLVLVAGLVALAVALARLIAEQWPW